VFDETLFPFSEMSTTPQDPDTLAFLDDVDDSSSPVWPRAVTAGTRLPGGIDAAPGTLGGAPSSGASDSAGPSRQAAGSSSLAAGHGHGGLGQGASQGASFSTGPAGAAAPVDTVSQVVASGAGRTTDRTTAATPKAIVPVTNAHSMRTRGKDGFWQPVDRLNLHMTAAATSPVPSSVRAALSDPAWRLTM
jgi:hypothetical protein